MKKLSMILYIIAGLFFLMGASSCKKSFLEVEHYSILSGDQMYTTDENAKAGLSGCYDMMYPATTVVANDGWNFKPNLFIGGHPTMDTQATGWDKNWNTQNWDPTNAELATGWKHCYVAISRCNDYLAGLAKADKISADLKKYLEGEARCIRAFFYMYLAKAFGRVPLLATGETYLTTPVKARAKDYAEMWDFIIADLKVASTLLDWEPMKGEYGRCTKGFALSFLGEAYMWKAYRVPAEAAANYALAKEALGTVIKEGPYELNKSYTTLWDPGATWTRECIWEVLYDQGQATDKADGNSDNRDWLIFFTACPKAGGWGSLYLSWEWWSSYEAGDKRRDASGVTANVKDIKPEWKSATNYNYNPYLQQELIPNNDTVCNSYHFTQGGELAPGIWSLKYWRTSRAGWAVRAYGPQQIYYKRLTNVMFDYAECLFRLNGENDAEAWDLINKVRNRGFGNLEVGYAEALTNTYLPYYKQMASVYGLTTPTTYPLPFSTATVSVTDAQAVYSQVKADKGFTLPVWQVALGMERRKEFNAEWSLAPDLIRSGFIEEHILKNYPKGTTPSSDPAAYRNDWHTYRSFDFNIKKMDMPIPIDELLKNPACDQNEAYQ